MSIAEILRKPGKGACGDQANEYDYRLKDAQPAIFDSRKIRSQVQLDDQGRPLFLDENGEQTTKDTGRPLMVPVTQRVPNLPSMRWTNAGGAVVAVPIMTTRNVKMGNDNGAYEAYIRRRKLADGWLPFDEPQYGLSPAAWEKKRAEIIAERRAQHRIDMLPYEDEAKRRLEEEVKKISAGVATGMELGLTKAVKTLQETATGATADLAAEVQALRDQVKALSQAQAPKRAKDA